MTDISLPGRAGYTGGVHWRIATLGSQALNVLLFGGSPDETVSARSPREGDLLGNPRWARRRVLIDRVFGPGHCEESHRLDLAFACYVLTLEPRSPAAS